MAISACGQTGVAALGTDRGVDASGSKFGVYAQATGANATGVRSEAGNGDFAKAVWGVAVGGYGGFFEAPGTLGWGIYATGGKYGAFVATPEPAGTGLWAAHDASTGTAAGIRGASSSTSDGAVGVFGLITSN